MFAVNSYAANKTHVNDMQGAGNSQVEVTLSSGATNTPGKYTFASGSAISMDRRTSGSTVSAGYIFGITDRIDIGLLIPVSQSLTVNRDYVNGNRYNETTKYEGQGNMAIGLKYLILDKQKDQMSWTVQGIIQPSYASSEAATTEVQTNGVVTTAGKTGTSGNSYTTTALKTTLSVPVTSGDLFVGVGYTSYGEGNLSGTVFKNGTNTSVTLGIETMANDRVTVTPYVKYSMTASGYGGTTTISNYTEYLFGVSVTNDVNKSLSLKIGAEYTALNDLTYTYSNSDKVTYSGNGANLNLSALIFF